MAVIGNDRKFYLTTSSHASYNWLKGEQSNSFSRSAETIEISDKDTTWAKFISGKKSATANVTVNLDDSATEQQHSLLKSLHSGEAVYCFVGTLGSGSTPSEGDVFQAIITGINDTNDQDAVASREISLQITGEPTHYPAL